MSQVKGVLLVGSVPLANTEAVLRKCAPALKNRIRYLPDGETGERSNFIAWQLGKFGAAPEVLSPYGDFGKPAEVPIPEQQTKAAAEKLEGMATDYDTVAIESYQTFKKLREEGVIPEHVKFQVCLPTPLTFVGPFITADYKDAIEPVYERAILSALENVTKSIPAQDLAIQWDVPVEFALLESVWIAPWFQPIREGILERLFKLGDAVDTAIDMGFHLCYGDIGHQHFTQPKDTGNMVDIATELLANLSRKVDWMHLPVPMGRDDAAYFAALKELQAVRGETDIYLGLVHSNDLEGTQRRIKAASEVLDGFGVATECGWGRTSPEDVESIIDISNAVADEIA